MTQEPDESENTHTPPAPPAGVYYATQDQTRAPQTDTGAIIALICGILSISGSCGPVGIVAIIFGKKSQRKIRESNGYLTGDSLAKAGIITGWIGLAITAVYIFVLIVWLGFVLSNH